MASPPGIPDPNKAAVQGAIANAENFPFEYIINQLAQLGGKATVKGQTYDFSGLGTADNAREMSDQMAKALLDVQKNFGADFVQQRLADLKRADPEGYAARQQLFDKIIADARANPDRPLADELQKQINDQLQNAGRLTAGPGGELEQIQQAVRGKQLANNIYLGNAPASEEASAVERAGESKRTAVQGAASNYLAAGVSPEDVKYRRIQQSLANLGAAISGQTPEAQFGSLSGAGNGAAPFTPNYSNPAGIDPNAALEGINNANSIYSGKVNWSQSQVNPWLAGLSTAMSGVNTAAGLGWSPFSNNNFSAAAMGGAIPGPQVSSPPLAGTGGGMTHGF